MFGSLVSGVLGTGLGIYQAIQGSKDKKRAERELNEYERQALNNAYENIQISTIGSDLMTQESRLTAANLTNAVTNAGTRAIIGGIPKIQANINTQNETARKYLDDQVNQRQYAIAEDDIRIRNIKEDRDNANIEALSSQVNAGKQDMWNGVIGAYKGVSALANSFDQAGDKLISGSTNGAVNPKTADNSVNASNIVSPMSKVQNPRYLGFDSNSSFSAPPNLMPNDFFGSNENVNNKYHYNF